MTFEVFQRPRKGRPVGEGMFVRVSSKGRILHLNAKAYQELGEPKFVLLYRDGDSVAFGPAEDDDPAGFSAALGNISCTRFIEATGLVLGARLPLRWEGSLLRTDGAGTG